MLTTAQKTANMLTAATSAAQDGFLFIVSDHGVTCYAPLGRKDDAEYFIREIKAALALVKSVDTVDWPIEKVNTPASSKDVLLLQAALDAAGLTSQTLVYKNDGIKINTNGPTAEVYEALFLLRNMCVTFFEGTFFQHF